MARPTKLNDVLERNLVNAIRAGTFVHHACRAFGVDPSTYHRWMASDAPRYREFRNKIERARAEANVEAVAQIRMGGRDDWRAAAWFLEKSFPEDYGAKVKAEITGAEGGPIEVAGRVMTLDLAKLPPEAVAAIVKQLDEESDDSDRGARNRLRGPRADPAAGSG